MTEQDISRYQDILITTATEVGLKLLAAIAFWVIGRWLIGMALRMLRSGLEKQKVDPTLLRYIGSIVTVTLNVLLVIGILGYFGIQTTTFAALIAAGGVAIGMAWSGLLAHFAAGAFNVFSDTIQNFTVNPFRRVDLKCQLSGAADHKAAMALLREKIAMIPNVLPEPKVDVEILDFTLVGPVLAVRPYCHNDNYWQVYFDTNKVLREALAEAGFPAPMPAQSVIVTQAA